MPDRPEQKPASFPLPSALLLTGGFVVAAIAVALTFPSRAERWEGHAATALVGLILLVGIVWSGWLTRRRIVPPHLRTPYRFHHLLSTGFTLFIVATFILGLLTTAGHGEELLESPHGILGLVLVVLVLVQLVPSFLLRGRGRIPAFHRYLGYSIVLVILLQVVLGIFAALLPME